MSFAIYVVSLKDAVERRESISNQINRPFEYIDSVDFRNVSGEKAKSHIKNDSAFFKTVRRNLVKSEVGCSLSHLKAYKNLSESIHDYALILEDDAIIPKNIMELVSRFCEENKKNIWDVLLLGYSKLSKDESRLFYKKEPLNTIHTVDSYKVGTVWRNWTSGTVGYLISKNAAERIVKEFPLDQIITVADDWLFFEKDLQIKISHIRPLIVFEDFERLGSSIECERKTFIAKERKLTCYLRVLRGYMRAFLMHFKKNN